MNTKLKTITTVTSIVVALLSTNSFADTHLNVDGILTVNNLGNDFPLISENNNGDKIYGGYEIFEDRYNDTTRITLNNDATRLVMTTHFNNEDSCKDYISNLNQNILNKTANCRIINDDQENNRVFVKFYEKDSMELSKTMYISKTDKSKLKEYIDKCNNVFMPENGLVKVNFNENEYDDGYSASSKEYELFDNGNKAGDYQFKAVCKGKDLTLTYENTYQIKHK